MTESTPELEGLKRQELQKLVKELGVNSFGKSNDVLAEELKAGVHALAIEPAAPGEKTRW